MTKWKRRLKRECILILTAAVMCGCLNVPGTPAFAEKDSAAVEEPSDAETAVSFTVPFPGDDLADPDTLFAGYIEKVFCGGQNTGSPALGAMGERRLQGYDKELYDALKEKIGQIASGTLEGTRVAVVLSEPLKWKIEDPESKTVEDEFNGTIDIENILTCLRADSPYELYWLDKTAEVYVGYSYRFDGQYHTVSQVDFSFAVSAGYQADGNPYKVDRQQAAEVGLAAENARAIVEQYKDRSDYEKLKAYLQEICGLVSYGITAETDEEENGVVETDSEAPWQMIRVFDGKADTNAACQAERVIWWT